jgi:hypothetical protein
MVLPSRKRHINITDIRHLELRLDIGEVTYKTVTDLVTVL